MAKEPSPLAADVLGPGVAKIAEYSPDNERRVRHLIANYDFPHVYIGGLIYSRKSWLERYYSGERAIVNGRDAKAAPAELPAPSANEVKAQSAPLTPTGSGVCRDCGGAIIRSHARGRAPVRCASCRGVTKPAPRDAGRQTKPASA